MPLDCTKPRVETRQLKTPSRNLSSTHRRPRLHHPNVQSPAKARRNIPRAPFMSRSIPKPFSSRITLALPNLVFTVPSQLRVLLVYASSTSSTNAPRCQAFHFKRCLNSKWRSDSIMRAVLLRILRPALWVMSWVSKVGSRMIR